MKDKTGKSFENLVGRIYEILSRNEANTNAQVDVEIQSPDGPRQFDVVITSKVATIEIVTVIEVRDWNKNLSVTHIDGLHSKMRDVNANKAILIARKGFSSGAIKKAKRLNIDLCTAHDIENIKDFVPKAPVVVHYLTFDFTSIGCKYLRSGRTTIDYMKFRLDGRPVLDLFREELSTLSFIPKIVHDKSILKGLYEKANKMTVGGKTLDISQYGEYLNVWKPNDISKVTYQDPSNGRNVAVSKFDVSFLMKYEYYFGYLNDLPGSIALTSLSAARADLFFLKENLNDFEKHFSKFSEISKIPIDKAVNIFALANFNFEMIPSKDF